MTGRAQYLTTSGLQALQDEFTFLKDTKIPEIATRIDEAKQQGDLSENAEYHQAKEDMAWAQGRLQELQYIIDNAQIFEDKTNDGGKVTIGNTVVIKTGEKTKTFMLVGPQEASPQDGRISNESPLGQALLGHKNGDKIEIITPAGKQICEIINVK